MYEELELTNGTKVKVSPVPSFAIAAAVGTVTMPEPPTIKIQTAAGHEEPWPDTSPESEAYQVYLRAKEIAEAARNKKQNELTLLMGLPEVTPAEGEDWFEPLAYVGIEPRAGKLGRKLDYIQYVLLANPLDLTRVFDAINTISFPREDAIRAQMESFRGHRGRNGAQSVPAAAERGAV